MEEARRAEEERLLQAIEVVTDLNYLHLKGPSWQYLYLFKGGESFSTLVAQGRQNKVFCLQS